MVAWQQWQDGLHLVGLGENVARVRRAHLGLRRCRMKADATHMSPSVSLSCSDTGHLVHVVRMERPLGCRLARGEALLLPWTGVGISRLRERRTLSADLFALAWLVCVVGIVFRCSPRSPQGMVGRPADHCHRPLPPTTATDQMLLKL